MKQLLTTRNIVIALLVVALFLVPLYAVWAKNNFILSLFTRIVILAIAATSLNLIMGLWRHGQLRPCRLSRHRRLLRRHSRLRGLPSGFVQWPLAIADVGLWSRSSSALLSLRTRGVYFIMITLAFAQMIYYVGVSLNRYGADDGLTIYQAAASSAACINLSNKTVFYYVCLVILMASIYLVWRLVNSRFGMVIQGSRSNDRRMRAIGFPTFRYRLACFVIAGMMCGLAGVLLANHTDFISPAMMHWTRSGDLIVMVVLGGMGSLFGPTIGAVAFLVLEEVLPPLISSSANLFTMATGMSRPAHEYWQIDPRPDAAPGRAVRARRH